MKMSLRACVLFFVFCISSISFAQNNHWSFVSHKGDISPKSSVNIPDNHILLRLDLQGMKQDLQKSNQQSLSLKFPNNDKKFVEYIIEESSIMNPELQAKYPDIRSYKGYQKSNPSNSVRFSISPYDGFNAIFASPEGVNYIDAYSSDNQTYMLYAKKELNSHDKDYICESEKFEIANKYNFAQEKISSDGYLRKYRLALACTAEYSDFHVRRANLQSAPIGEKKAAVLSAMITAMTRVNSIYEKELAITMELIPNNDLLIFIDNDNYTNDNAGDMLDENQAVIDNLVGASNYDIGHVFSTGGGGIAYINSVCSKSKAGGVTGLSSPIGDAFYVDFVTHEMGHQFGAYHTFNNSCSSNRNPSSAVEPGSGSTIMSYAGICEPNVQKNSDVYFHSVSISEIQQSSIHSSSSCGEKIPLSKSAPVANAGKDYTIPKSTPFVLSSTSSDSNENLTYNWEQIDNEIASMPPVSTSTKGPLFRSNYPSTSPDRYFPKLSSVIKKETDKWEVLPSAGRSMNFSLIVRDNDSSGGQTSIDEVKLTVDENSGPFVITSQNTNETWNSGNYATVEWNPANSNASPVNCQSVKILLSTDGGLTFPIILSENAPNNGKAYVEVPANTNTETARIMVKANDNVFFAVNDSDFTISSEILNPKTEKTTLFFDPYSGSTKIALKESIQNPSYKIYDVYGNLIRKISSQQISIDQNQNLDLGHLPSGIYIIELKNAGKTLRRKYVVANQ